MGVSLEPVYFVVRVGPDHEFGKAFNCAFHASKSGWEQVRVVGLPEMISKEDFKKLRELLKGYGFKKAIWERVKDGKPATHEFIL